MIGLDWSVCLHTRFLWVCVLALVLNCTLFAYFVVYVFDCLWLLFALHLLCLLFDIGVYKFTCL